MRIALRTLLVAALLQLSALASAEQPVINPYRLWWSFPADDHVAIEIDDPDLSASPWQSRWQFARDMKTCDAKASQLLAQRRDKSVREVRIETLDGSGQVRAVARCVMTVKEWRRRLGNGLYERLESELDAHDSFLHPRRYPGMPQRPENQPQPAREQ